MGIEPTRAWWAFRILSLTEAGVGPAGEAVTYCAIGMRASLMAFAARAVGVTTHLYLASWQDWSKDRSNPIDR